MGLNGNAEGKRRICIIMLVLTVVFCLWGCSAEKTEDQVQENATGTEQAAEESLRNDLAVSEEDYVYALVKQTSYENGEKTSETSYVYDEYGRLVQVDIDGEAVERWDEELQLYIFTHRADGTFDYAVTFEYDEFDNIIKKSYINLVSNNPVQNYYEYQYDFDENGNVMRCMAYYRGQGEDPEFAIDYVWENGQLTWERFLCSEDSWYDDYMGAYHYHYDSQGRICSVGYVSLYGTVLTTIGYDDLGRMSQIHMKAIGETEEEMIQYSYDADGNLLLTDDEIERFAYDENGNLIAVYYEDGDYSEYVFQRINMTDKSVWNGNVVSLIRQSYVTNYYPIHILGVSYGACVFDFN